MEVTVQTKRLHLSSESSKKLHTQIGHVTLSNFSTVFLVPTGQLNLRLMLYMHVLRFQFTFPYCRFYGEAASSKDAAVSNIGTQLTY